MRTLTLQPRYHRHGYVQPFLSDRELSPAVAIIGAAHPPYDLERLDADHHRLSIATPGLEQEHLTVNVERDILSVESHGCESPDSDFLHRGISRKRFVLRFRLGEHIKVSAATLKNGLLTLELTREIPEARKPRVIPVN